MTLFPLTDCCERLSVDPKTLQKSDQARGDASAGPSDRRSRQMLDPAASSATGQCARAKPPVTPAAPERAILAHSTRSAQRPRTDADWSEPK